MASRSNAPSGETWLPTASDSAALVLAASSPAAAPRLSVGITTFISATLRRGRPFNIKRPKIHTAGGRAKGGGANTGKAIGRFTDHLFSRVIRGQAKLSQTDPRHSRCRDIFSILKKLKCRPIATQTPVNLGQNYRLRTQLDGVAITNRGGIVVLEIKTTQYSLKAYEKMYSQQAIGNPKLRNGAANTEETAHQLQLAFGCLALRRELEQRRPNKVPPITGKIILLCSDGAKSVSLNPMFLHPKWFDLASVDAQPPRKATTSKSRQASDLGSLPEAEGPKHKILAYVRKHVKNATFAESPGEYGSFCVSGDGGRCVVVGLLHGAPSSGSTRVKASREKLVEDVLSLRDAGRGYKKVTGALLFYKDGSYVYKPVKIPKKAA